MSSDKEDNRLNSSNDTNNSNKTNSSDDTNSSDEVANVFEPNQNNGK